MPERIFLTYTNATAVPYEGSVLGHHIVLNYVDSDGLHHTLQRVPEHRFEHNIDKLGAFAREEFLSDGTNSTDSPFQRLQVNPEHIDSEVPPGPTPYDGCGRQRLEFAVGADAGLRRRGELDGL